MKTIALIGNPNCGKTTFFNKVTGAGEYVGNRTGVTVKETLRKVKGRDIVLCDLPGIYSLSGYSEDEKTALNFITLKNPSGIINIADGTNLQRALYLTVQLLKLNLPVILAINMKDECDKRKIDIDIQGLSKELGIDVFFISSKNGEGTDKLMSAAVNIKRAEITAFNKLVKKLRAYEETYQTHNNEIRRANSIYAYVDELIKKYVTDRQNKFIRTKILDYVLLNKYLAYPIFVLIMAGVFYITFGKFGQIVRDLFLFFARIIVFKPLSYLSSFGGEFLNSLICEGIIPGVESVLSYLPLLIIMFMLVHFLEDSGYTARIAYMMDSFMQKLGLSGKSVIPLILGFGCTTPAIMSARIIEDKRVRMKTVFLTPFISCSAKIPVYSMLASMFLKEGYISLFVLIYLLSIGVVILLALITGNKHSQETVIIELPEYRIPSAENVFKMTKLRIKEFLKKAGTVIAGVSVIIWFLNSYDFSLVRAASEESMLSYISRNITFLFKPIGFSDCRIVSSLISGIAAKETIASTLNITAGGTGNISMLFTPASAISFMCFVLLYMPCLPSFITLIKETRSVKLAVKSVAFHFGISYLVSFILYRIF